MKPSLLVVELWGLGDLIIATPFLQAASEKFQVTLVAKPFAKDLQPRFWPAVTLVPFVAPWTAFEGKYRLWRWPWREIFRLLKKLADHRFDFALSGRWDPRDHVLLRLVSAQARLGFARMGSQLFLTRPLARPDRSSHRFENWRAMAARLGLELPARDRISLPTNRAGQGVLIHTGAGQPVRVWPLERYLNLVKRLRQLNVPVQVVCDPDQLSWWRQAGHDLVVAPRTVAELIGLLDRASAFVGNDSGAGHLAAFCGVPTFTIFGPQLPEWFAPLHPKAEWLEGKPCPYKPCSDSCRFPTPGCILDSGEEEVWERVSHFLRRNLPGFPT